MKVGDVVRLRSGSDPMTVESIDGDSISVVWFGKNPTELYRATIRLDAVEMEDKL
jgi:uncharacterized protein YodC (DUF2158 family)